MYLPIAGATFSFDGHLRPWRRKFGFLCTQFNYLGSIVTLDLDDTSAIDRRVSLAQDNVRSTSYNSDPVTTNSTWTIFIASFWPVVNMVNKNSHFADLSTFHNHCARTRTNPLALQGAQRLQRQFNTRRIEFTSDRQNFLCSSQAARLPRSNDADASWKKTNILTS